MVKEALPRLMQDGTMRNTKCRSGTALNTVLVRVREGQGVSKVTS